MRSIRRSGALLLASALGVLGLASCTGSAGTAPPDPPPASATVPTPSASGPASASPSASVDPSGAPSGSASPTDSPVAQRVATISGQRVTLDVFPVRRSGTLSILDFTLTLPAVEAGAAPKSLVLTTQFDDLDGTTGDRSPYTVDGVRLLDTKNRKAYLVASDSRKKCLCSNDLNSIQMQSGETHTFFATFAAPPAAVTEVEVSVPRFGAIPRVPVT